MQTQTHRSINRAFILGLMIFTVPITATVGTIVYFDQPAPQSQLQEVAQTVRGTDWSSCDRQSGSSVNNAATHIQETLARGDVLTKGELKTVAGLAKNCSKQIAARHESSGTVAAQKEAVASAVTR